MVDVGKKIKAARQKKGMSQEELARFVGTTKSAVSRYEGGKRQPRFDQLQRIAAVLGVPIHDLMGLTPFMKENVTPPDGPTMAEIEREAAAQGMTVTEYLLSKPETEELGRRFAAHDARLSRFLQFSPPPKYRIAAALDQLNDEGQEKAAERVEELTEVPKYQRAGPPESTETAPGTDTTQPPNASQGPQDGQE